MLKNVACEICSSEILTQVGPFDFKSKLLGNISVPAIKQYVCSGCGKVLIALNEVSKVRVFVQEQEHKAIAAMPINDFISPNQAADILGISKQAFSKNPRIKKGLICSTVIDSKKLYLKKSVEEFKIKYTMQRGTKQNSIILKNHRQ